MTTTRRARLAAACALMVLVSGCGGGGTSPDPVPTATPPPAPTTTVIFESGFPPLAPFVYTIGTFPIPSGGSVRVTMDWTFATNDMVLFVFSGATCTDVVTFVRTGTAPGCTVLGQHVTRGVKPAVVTFSVPAAQDARVLVGNLGPTGESGVVQVTLTR